MQERANVDNAVDRIIYRVMDEAITEARVAQELCLTRMQIKAIARVESRGAFCVPINCCTNVEPVGFRLACKKVGVDFEQVKQILTFRFANRLWFPRFEIKDKAVEEAVLMAESFGEPRAKFILGCMWFGLFNLDSQRVAARQILAEAPLKAVAEIVCCPTRQILEFNRQFQDDWQECGGTFEEAAEFWRTGQVTHDKVGYYGQVCRAVAELRVQGHGDR